MEQLQSIKDKTGWKRRTVAFQRGHRYVLVLVMFWALMLVNPESMNAEERPLSVNGVFPNLTVMAKGTGSDSETGIGALIPWAEKLWAVGYVAHIRGEGLGLYEISDNMTMRRHPASACRRASSRS